jgi:hypothetical protein
MKKLFIIASAAVIALAACTKSEVNNVTSENGPAISFQVANYAGQTKAGETSLITEGFNNFTTYAWYTSTTADNQAFMTPATVTWNSTAKEWAPSDRVYYWPKTGYINFFSFAGKHLPDAVDLNGSSQAEAHYTTTITVAKDDNILVADGAYGFYMNKKPATYGKDEVSEGVPTLFRHMLSRVKFDIKVDATDANSEKDHWKVTVNSATVSYRNQGTLEVGFPSTPAITWGADNKPTTAGQTLKYTSQAWTPATVANVNLEKVASDVIVETDGKSASAAKELIADSVVMPQTLGTTNVTVELNYTLEHSFDGSTPISEIVPISATALTTFSPSITVWEPNTIYTYHITIKPTANRILFDPAVETWASEANEPGLVIE